MRHHHFVTVCIFEAGRYLYMNIWGKKLTSWYFGTNFAVPCLPPRGSARGDPEPEPKRQRKHAHSESSAPASGQAAGEVAKGLPTPPPAPAASLPKTSTPPPPPPPAAAAKQPATGGKAQGTPKTFPRKAAGSSASASTGKAGGAPPGPGQAGDGGGGDRPPKPPPAPRPDPPGPAPGFVDPDDQEYLARGVYDVVEYMRVKGLGQAAAPFTPTREWEQFVNTFLSLYISVTNHTLEQFVSDLTFQEKCQAITRLMKDNGHGWVPFCGEDLYQMASTARPVKDFFRLPDKYFLQACK